MNKKVFTKICKNAVFPLSLLLSLSTIPTARATTDACVDKAESQHTIQCSMVAKIVDRVCAITKENIPQELDVVLGAMKCGSIDVSREDMMRALVVSYSLLKNCDESVSAAELKSLVGAVKKSLQALYRLVSVDDDLVVQGTTTLIGNLDVSAPAHFLNDVTMQATTILNGPLVAQNAAFSGDTVINGNNIIHGYEIINGPADVNGLLQGHAVAARDNNNHDLQVLLRYDAANNQGLIDAVEQNIAFRPLNLGIGGGGVVVSSPLSVNAPMSVNNSLAAQSGAFAGDVVIGGNEIVAGSMTAQSVAAQNAVIAQDLHVQGSSALGMVTAHAVFCQGNAVVNGNSIINGYEIINGPAEVNGLLQGHYVAARDEGNHDLQVVLRYDAANNQGLIDAVEQNIAFRPLNLGSGGGGVVVSSPLSVNAPVSVNNSMAAQSAAFAGDIAVGGNEAVAGTVTAQSVAAQNVEIAQDLHVQGSSALGMVAAQGAIFAGDVVVAGATTVGALAAQSAAFAGNVIVNANQVINGQAEVNGLLQGHFVAARDNINHDLQVVLRYDAANNQGLIDAVEQNVAFRPLNLGVGGGGVVVSSPLTVNASMNVSGSLTAQGATVGVLAAQSGAFAGDLTVGGNEVVTGSMTAQSVAAQNVMIAQDLHVQGSSVLGMVTAQGATFGGNVAVAGATTVGSLAAQSGLVVADLSVGGNEVVAGSITAQSVAAQNAVIAQDLQVQGSSALGMVTAHAVFCQGNAVVNGNNIINGYEIINGQAEVNGLLQGHAVAARDNNNHDLQVLLRYDAANNQGLIDAVEQNIAFRPLNLGSGGGGVVVSSPLSVNAPTTFMAGVIFPSYTTAQRDMLPAVNGMVVFNVDDQKLQVYAAGSWMNLH